MATFDAHTTLASHAVLAGIAAIGSVVGVNASAHLTGTAGATLSARANYAGHLTAAAVSGMSPVAAVSRSVGVKMRGVSGMVAGGFKSSTYDAVAVLRAYSDFQPHGARHIDASAKISAFSELKPYICTSAYGLQVGDAIDAILNMWGSTCSSGNCQSPAGEEAVNCLNAAFQRLYASGKVNEFINQVTRTVDLSLSSKPYVAAVPVSADVQSVCAPVELKFVDPAGLVDGSPSSVTVTCGESGGSSVLIVKGVDSIASTSGITNPISIAESLSAQLSSNASFNALYTLDYVPGSSAFTVTTKTNRSDAIVDSNSGNIINHIYGTWDGVGAPAECAVEILTITGTCFLAFDIGVPGFSPELQISTTASASAMELASLAGQQMSGDFVYEYATYTGLNSAKMHFRRVTHVSNPIEVTVTPLISGELANAGNTIYASDGYDDLPLTEEVELSRRALRPLGGMAALQSFQLAYFNGSLSSAQEPLAYFVETDFDDSNTSRIHVVPRDNPASALAVVPPKVYLEYGAVLKPIRFSCQSPYVRLPVPHKYAETLLLPLAKYYALGSRYFQRPEIKDSILQQAREVLTLLGEVDPLPKEVPFKAPAVL